MRIFRWTEEGYELSLLDTWQYGVNNLKFNAGFPDQSLSLKINTFCLFVQLIFFREELTTHTMQFRSLNKELSKGAFILSLQIPAFDRLSSRIVIRDVWRF